jgi:hypothetical protein
MSLCPDRRVAEKVDKEYKRIRLELVARARWVWAEESWVRKVASMISSLNPITCRVGRPVSSEWNMIFWSAWIETRSVEYLISENLAFYSQDIYYSSLFILIYLLIYPFYSFHLTHFFSLEYVPYFHYTLITSCPASQPSTW